MAYVKITNGTVDTYPYNVGQLRRDNANTSFPKQIPAEMLEAYGVFAVSYTDAPAIDERTQKLAQEAQPSLVNGVWTVGWAVSDKTAEEVQQYDADAASNARSKRDNLLSDCDWIVIMHTEKGTNIPLEWEVYRQALRDITSHANFPHLSDADWPVKP